MQTARNLVRVRIELPARVQLGHHDLGRRDALFLVKIDRDPAAVVDDRDRIVLVNRDVDFSAIPGQSFVDGVVDDLVNQVVETSIAGRSDIHRRTQAHSLQPLEYFDTGGVVDLHAG